MKNISRDKWIIVGVVLVGVFLFFLTGLEQIVKKTPKQEEAPETNTEALREEIDSLLKRLPNNFTVGSRTAVMDRQTIKGAERTSYSEREASTLPNAGEDPVEYIERIIRTRLESEEVKTQPESFSFLSSFYEMDGVIVAFLHVSRIPDDSLGAAEERFEFEKVGGEWKLEWYGKRNFCRRPIPGIWLKADELCP